MTEATWHDPEFREWEWDSISVRVHPVDCPQDRERLGLTRSRHPRFFTALPTDREEQGVYQLPMFELADDADNSIPMKVRNSDYPDPEHTTLGPLMLGPEPTTPPNPSTCPQCQNRGRSITLRQADGVGTTIRFNDCGHTIEPNAEDLNMYLDALDHPIPARDV